MTTDTLTVPTVDRAWELLELAYAEDGITVLGWADNGVVDAANRRPMECWFPVLSETHDQEGSVLVVALRIPHPDLMSASTVVGEGESR